MHSKLSRYTIINSILLVITIASGILLAHGGWPNLAFVFSIHKLTPLAIIVFTILATILFAKSHQLQSLYLTLTFATISIIALFISGTFLYLNKYTEIMLIIHHISILIFIISIALLHYKFLKNKQQQLPKK